MNENDVKSQSENEARNALAPAERGIAELEAVQDRRMAALDRYVAGLGRGTRAIIESAARKGIDAGVLAVSIARQLGGALCSCDQGECEEDDALRLLLAERTDKDESDNVMCSIIAYAVQIIDAEGQGGEVKRIPMIQALTVGGDVIVTFGFRAVDDLAMLAAYAERPSRSHPWRITFRKRALGQGRTVNTIEWHGYGQAADKLPGTESHTEKEKEKRVTKKT